MTTDPNKLGEYIDDAIAGAYVHAKDTAGPMAKAVEDPRDEFPPIPSEPPETTTPASERFDNRQYFENARAMHTPAPARPPRGTDDELAARIAGIRRRQRIAALPRAYPYGRIVRGDRGATYGD